MADPSNPTVPVVELGEIIHWHTETEWFVYVGDGIIRNEAPGHGVDTFGKRGRMFYRVLDDPKYSWAGTPGDVTWNERTLNSYQKENWHTEKECPNGKTTS